MESFLVSTGIVAIAEIGDKTQLLALLLAAKFRKPLPIIAGIFIATVANHAGAAIIGSWIAALIGPDTMRWLLAAGFVAMGIWVLIPDKVDDDEAEKAPRYGVLVTTVIAFFLLEMGDKTQIATIALAARYPDWWLVTMGTTFGMMIANVPAVLVGQAATQVLPLRVVHIVAALAFFVLGALLAADGIPHLLG
ncbi:MAG: TMEM165/GDT1 family protein [Magnetospirillum sp.]